LHGNRLGLNPVIPAHWDGFEIIFRYRSARYEIHVINAPGQAPVVEFDGRQLAPGESDIPLADDGGNHVVRIVLARRA
jgi:cyclic beta-1,2-glucan synthetase